MEKRDLMIDLEIVEAINRQIELSDGENHISQVVLPHALRRAIAAEEENERLKSQLDDAVNEMCNAAGAIDGGYVVTGINQLWRAIQRIKGEASK